MCYGNQSLALGQVMSLLLLGRVRRERRERQGSGARLMQCRPKAGMEKERWLQEVLKIHWDWRMQEEGEGREGSMAQAHSVSTGRPVPAGIIAEKSSLGDSSHSPDSPAWAEVGVVTS